MQPLKQEFYQSTSKAAPGYDGQTGRALSQRFNFRVYSQPGPVVLKMSGKVTSPHLVYRAQFRM